MNEMFNQDNGVQVNPYGTGAPTNPYGTGAPTNPYGTGAPVSLYGTGTSANPYGTGAPVNPYGAGTPANPYGSAPVSPNSTGTYMDNSQINGADSGNAGFSFSTMSNMSGDVSNYQNNTLERNPSTGNDVDIIQRILSSERVQNIKRNAMKCPWVFIACILVTINMFEGKDSIPVFFVFWGIVLWIASIDFDKKE